MGGIFGIAALSALDAGLLTAAVALLGRPRPASQLGAYLIGGMGLSIVFGLVIVLALHGSQLRIGRSTKGTAYSVPGAYYLAGLALLVKLKPSVTTSVLAVLGFNVIMFSLIELPLIGLLVAPDPPSHGEAQPMDGRSAPRPDRDPGRRDRRLPARLRNLRSQLRLRIFLLKYLLVICLHT